MTTGKLPNPLRTHVHQRRTQSPLRTSIRTLLIKPVHPFDATPNRSHGNPDKIRCREVIAEEIETTAHETDNGLLGVLLHLQLRQSFPRHDRSHGVSLRRVQNNSINPFRHVLGSPGLCETGYHPRPNGFRWPARVAIRHDQDRLGGGTLLARCHDHGGHIRAAATVQFDLLGAKDILRTRHGGIAGQHP